MSLLDAVLANTLGVAFRAYSGNVDPWTLQVQKDNTAAAIKQALGPNASPEDVAAKVAAAQAEIEIDLRRNDAHPDQAGLRLPIIGELDLPKLNKLVNGAVIVLAVGAILYFGGLYHVSIRREFNKLKKGR